MSSSESLSAEAEPQRPPVPSEDSPRFGTDLDELIRQHRELDDRLQEMARRRSLTPEEQHEAAVMKKRKLALKDRIAAMTASA